MKPIIFSTRMVRAILDGEKTMTRRVIKPQPVRNGNFYELGGAGWSVDVKTIFPVYGHSLYNRMPHKPYDILYVRETWGISTQPAGGIIYKADGNVAEGTVRWRPSIHMPKSAARIFLRVTDVKVERVRDITTVDIAKEGFKRLDVTGYSCVDIACAEAMIDEFKELWDSLNVPRGYGWDSNPWVWVYEFESNVDGGEKS